MIRAANLFRPPPQTPPPGRDRTRLQIDLSRGRGEGIRGVGGALLPPLLEDASPLSARDVRVVGGAPRGEGGARGGGGGGGGGPRGGKGGGGRRGGGGPGPKPHLASPSSAWAAPGT